MKKILSLILTAAILFSFVSTSAYCSTTAAVSVQYLNSSKSLALSGRAAGAEDDVITVFIYDYNASIQGVADNSAPKVFDTFLLGEGGSVNYELKLPDSLVGGKYVIRIATREGLTEKTFMHINDALAPNALADINAASDADFMNVLAVKGPQCGLDPDIYEANKQSVSSILLSYRGTGFAGVDSFLKLSNQAIAAAFITKGDRLESVLTTYGSYLNESDFIDCKADYEAAEPAVKSAFAEAIKSADFASSKGFCRVFRELLIYKQYEAASSWAEIKEVLNGTKNDAKVNNNPDILSLDTTDFLKLKNPDEVYREMYKRKAEVTNFSGIANLFKSTSANCLAAEKKLSQQTAKPSGGSSSGGGGISTSGIPSITPELIEGQNTNVKLSDIQGHWAQISIETLVKNNVISGYEDGSFKPDNVVTRSEFVKMIVAAFELGKEADVLYTDVPSDHWAYSYIKKAAASGIITGYEDGSFNPEGIITREQAAVIIYRAVSLKLTLPEGISDFIDIGEFSDYALRPILNLAGAGLINGTGDNLFSPNQSTTRAQTATLINNALEYIKAQ